MPVVSYSSSGGYISNVSQLRNSDGSANQTVLYYNQQNRVATYLDDAKLMYQLVQGADSSNADTSYRVDMRFTKGSTSQKVYAMNARKEYHNYYLGHMWRNGERTPIYNSIWKNNVYTNTDILYTNSNAGCRQYIIARSGAPTGDFEMTFDGQTSLSLSASGNLIIQTTIGTIEYAKPKAYSMNLTTGVLTLHTWQPSYVIVGNKVSFSGIGAWGGALVLEVGEPAVSSSSQQIENVDWSTMFGDNGEDQFKDVQSNSANDAFAIGESDSNSITFQIGAVIVPHAGERDIILVKFNEGCIAEYLTYYGGSSQDYAYALDLMPNDGAIHTVGATSSDDLVNIAEIEMEDSTLDGIQDGLYVKFDSAGFLQAHTYVGGTGSDVCTDIAVEYISEFNLPIIYYVGHTNSGNGWAPLVTGPNSNNMPYSGGIDGFYFKRSGPNELITHSTFFGSNENDWFTGVDLFKGSPVIVGITNESQYSANSQLGLLPTDGLFPKAHTPFYGSEFFSNNNTISHNYFVTWFGDNGIIPNQFFDQFRWCTYFSPSNDGLFYLSKGVIATDNEGLGVNDKGDVFLSGQVPTTDLTFPFTVQGWHQSSPGLAGTNDAFLVKFRLASDNSLLVRATLFGGDGNEYGSGFAIDPNNNVFLCGQSTINSIQNYPDWCTPPSNGDFPMCDHNGQLYTEENFVGTNTRAFVCAFRSDGEMLWSTQYGNGHQNAAHAMCASNDKVWMVGYSSNVWTFEEYVQGGGSDYFRNVDPSETEQEATIARFDIPLILSYGHSALQQSPTLNIFPNPNNGQFTLNCPYASSARPTILFVYNALGECVYQATITQSQQNIQLTDLAAGCYHVLAKSDAYIESIKFIKR
jgi:hypothetical protein